MSKAKQQRRPRSRNRVTAVDAGPSRWRYRFVVSAGLLILVVAAPMTGPAWQKYRLLRARNCLRNRELEQAERWLVAALNRDDQCGEGLVLLGRLRRRQGRLEDTRNLLLRAWKAGFDPEQIEREQWLALAQAGQLDKAEPHLNELLSQPQGDVGEICEAYLNGFLRVYRFDDAMRLLDAWEADFPGEAEPRIFRGMVFEHLFMAKNAVEEYKAACALAPDRLDIRLRLARQQVALLEYSEASEHYRYCLSQEPKHVEALIGYASCLMKQGMIEQPERLLGQALNVAPHNSAALAGLGRLAYSAGRYDEAVTILEEVVKSQPNDREFRYQLATALQASGQSDKAAMHFEFASEANNAMEDVRRLLEELRTDPTRIDLRHQIGATLLHFGSESDGVGWLQSVLLQQPDHLATHRVLAEYYESRNSPDLAAKHRRLTNSSL